MEGELTSSPVPRARRGWFRSSRLDLVVGMMSQVMMVGSGLILLPFVLATLTAAQVGIWYVFLTIQGVVFLLDFGASQTFVRFFGYVFAGAIDLKEGEVPEESANGKVDPRLLAALLATARRIYLVIALLAGGLMLTAGSYGIHVLTRDVDLTESVWPAWVVFVVTMLAQTYYQWQGPPLIGSGQTRRNYEIAVVSRTVQVVLSVIALMIHPSLLAMSLGFAASAVVMRVDYHRSLRSIREQVRGVAWAQSDYAYLAGVLFRSARQLGAMVVGVQLTSRFVVLAVAWYAGIEASAQFAITYQALVALNSVAFVAQTMFNPRAALARVSGDQDALRSLFMLSLVFGWGVYIAGGVALVYALPLILEVIGSNTVLPPVGIILLMLVNATIEMNMFTAANMITIANNTVPYWRAMLLSGATTVLAVLVVGELQLGLMAILLTQFMIQLAYNYWRWPVYCFVLLGLRPLDVLRYLMLRVKQAASC